MSDSQHTIYGIIGYPVAHSLSPVMHNTAFKLLEVDAEYRLFAVPPDDLESFFEDLHKEESPIFGLNVTVPYKEKVLPFIDNMTPFAKRAMTVNTIVINRDRQLTGYNTDGPGFLAHLAELKFDTKGKRIAILGAGGTTRAILTALCLIPERPDSIRIYNRTLSNTRKLLNDLGQRVDVSCVEAVPSIDDLNIELADLLINTTPVGMEEGDGSLVSPELIHGDMIVYDVIYAPAETPLLKIARDHGATAVNGLDLLFYQGVLAFQHWANMPLPEAVRIKMRQSLESAARG